MPLIARSTTDAVQTALTDLFDGQGRIRVALRHEQTVDDYTAEIRQLLAEKPV